MDCHFMRKSALAVLLGGSLAAALSPAFAQIKAGRPAAAQAKAPAPDAMVQGAWARAMLPGAKVGAGYFDIHNTGKTALRLAEVRSTVAQKVEIHSMSMEGNVMKMRHLGDGVEIAAQSSLSFAPGSYHLMFINPKKPFKAGEKFTAQFRFTNGTALDVPFIVRAAAAKAPKNRAAAHH